MSARCGSWKRRRRELVALGPAAAGLSALRRWWPMSDCGTGGIVSRSRCANATSAPWIFSRRNCACRLASCSCAACKKETATSPAEGWSASEEISPSGSRFPPGMGHQAQGERLIVQPAAAPASSTIAKISSPYRSRRSGPMPWHAPSSARLAGARSATPRRSASFITT